MSDDLRQLVGRIELELQKASPLDVADLNARLRRIETQLREHLQILREQHQEIRELRERLNGGGRS